MKPVLLLGVDGVILPFGSKAVDPAYGDMIVKLSKTFWIVWATSREEEGLVEIVTSLDLPRLPTMTFNDRTGKTWKLPEVRDFVGTVPLAWVDDEIFEDAFQWAKQRIEPTLLLRPNPLLGLNEEHCARLEDFGIRCSVAAG